MRRPGRAGLVLACLVGLLPACGVDGLSFVQDERVRITAPADRATVPLPVTITWTVHDFTVTGRDGSAGPDAGYFGILVDRAPPPPGETLEWLVRDDAECKVTPNCPNEAYLRSRHAYSTTDTTITIDRIPDLTRGQARDLHEATVVLLNGRGQRMGESAFRVEFEVARPKR